MEANRNDLDLDALPVAVRRAFLAERAARIVAKARVDQFEEHSKRLEYLVLEFKHALYGKKSERLDPDQLALAFEDLEIAVAEAETTGNNPTNMSLGC